VGAHPTSITIRRLFDATPGPASACSAVTSTSHAPASSGSVISVSLGLTTRNRSFAFGANTP
jgi:hypothetical protein